jgi:hypothetical protein
MQHRTQESDPTHQLREQEQAPPVQMIYVPPPEQVRPEPAPVPKRVPTPPVQPRREPEPEPNAPPEAERRSGTESDAPSPAAAEEGARRAAPEARAAPKEEETGTLESEARRIFGRPRLPTPAGAGPQAVRPMEAYVDRSERCTPEPRDPSAEPQFGTVVGRIFRQDNGRPLAGAHLQMLGAPYVAFTDANGEYRFRFDLALVDNCRTQYVRVSAHGYETRLLVLVVGPNARSEDVRLRRR